MRSGGGGGFGEPFTRPPSKVADDVRQGYVSISSAQRDYGVIFDDDGNLNLEATEKVRKSR